LCTLQANPNSGNFCKEDLVLLYKKYVSKVILLASRKTDRTISVRDIISAKSAPPDDSKRLTAERTRDFLSCMAQAGFGSVTQKLKKRNYFSFTAKSAEEMDPFCLELLKFAQLSRH